MEEIRELNAHEVEDVAGAVPGIILAIVGHFAWKSLDQEIDGGEQLPTKVNNAVKKMIDKK